AGEGKVKLRWMDRRLPVFESRERIGRIDEPPRQLGRLAVAAAVEEASDPAKHGPECNRGCERVRHLPLREPEAPSGNEPGNGSRCQAAVEREASLPYGEHPAQTMPKLVHMLEDVEHPSTEHRSH